MRAVYPVSLIFCLILSTHICAQSGKMQIAVVELQAAGISRTEAQTFTDRLRSELVKTGQFTILERTEMEEILKEQGFQLTGCTSAECAVEVGKLLNVRQICAGNVGKVGGVYSISIRLIDVESGKIIKSVTEDCHCPIERVLMVSLKNVALKVIGKYKSIDVQSNPAGATVFLDGIEQGKTPLSIGITDDTNVNLRISKTDHGDWNRTINLKTENISTINAELEKYKGQLKFAGDFNNSILSYGKNSIHIRKSEYDLPVGDYAFNIVKPGFCSKDFSVNIIKNKTTTYNVSLDPKTKGAAFLRSAILPGWGQAYQEKKIRSWVYSTLFIGSGAGAIVYTYKYNQAVSDYNDIYDQYLSAVEDAEINRLRNELKSSFDSVESNENLCSIFYATTALIWVWNIVDVLLLPPAWTKSVYISSTQTKNVYTLNFVYPL